MFFTTAEPKFTVFGVILRSFIDVVLMPSPSWFPGLCVCVWSWSWGERSLISMFLFKLYPMIQLNWRLTAPLKDRHVFFSSFCKRSRCTKTTCCKLASLKSWLWTLNEHIKMVNTGFICNTGENNFDRQNMPFRLLSRTLLVRIASH